jgi:hypothetical protein
MPAEKDCKDVYILHSKHPFFVHNRWTTRRNLALEATTL